MKKLLFIAIFWAGTAQAQQVLNGEAFDALSQGTTMYFSNNGQYYGSEQFLPNRRSVWRAQDGSCVNGKWAEVDGNICFLYDNDNGPHCWEVLQTDSGLTITSANGPPGVPPLVLELSGQDTTPIVCTGPKFGV